MILRKFFAVIGVMAMVLLNSCDQELDKIISRKSLPMDGSQEVPAKPGAWNGTIDIDYNQTTRTLYYTVKWNSLSGSIVGFHIHGSAGKGFNAPIIQNFAGYSTAQSGTYSGTVLMDGVLFKEEDLFRGGYYINIHTALNPGGELRGQIVF